MNSITDSDLAAVRTVLQQKTALGDVARTYPTRRATLVGVAILWAVGLTSFDRGQYGRWLEKIVRDPGKPAEGWPKGTSEPTWWYRKYASDFMRHSRGLGLHVIRRGSSSVDLVSVPRLEALLNEDPSYRETARLLYEQTINPATPVTPGLGLSAEAHAQLGRELHALRDRLNHLIAQFFPELPQ